MKLHKTHLFLILIAVLVLSTLGFTVREYFENKDSSSEKAMDDSVENRAPEGTEGLSSSGDDGSDYQSVISDLEDIVVPGRRERKHHHDSEGNHHHHHDHEGRKMEKRERKRERRMEKRERKLEKEVERQERRMAEDAGVDMSKYILKSEVVPPVCPKCPDSRTCPRQKPCPPCAPCARCPEQPFECKKVPNYRAASVSNVLPLPRLNSFAAFN